MDYIVAQYSDISFFGFWIGSSKQWSEILQRAKSKNFPQEIFSEIEYITEYLSFDDWTRRLTITEISKESATNVVRIFENDSSSEINEYGNQYGTWIPPED